MQRILPIQLTTPIKTTTSAILVFVLTLTACSGLPGQKTPEGPSTSDSQTSQNTNNAQPDGDVPVVPMTIVDPNAEVDTTSDATETQPNDAGPQLWALVLAGASSPGDPLLEQATQTAESLNFEATISNCHPSTAEAIGMNKTTTYTTHILFNDEQQARTAQQKFDPDYTTKITPTTSNCPN